MLTLLGGSAAASLAGCSAIFGDGGDGDGDGTPTPGDDDTPTPTPEPQRTNADKAQAAWETIEENPEPAAEDTRVEAFIDMEEAVRDSVIVLNWGHDIGERYSYPYASAPKIGALGGSFQQHNNTTVDNDTRLNLRNSTHNHIDPIESDDEASSNVITQLYEGLVTYPNGVPELGNALLESMEVSDDGLTYTFSIKQGVQFHGGGEVTAQDFIYSWRRVAESGNSVRANFLLSSADGIGIVHETDDEGNPVPDSLALEAVDDYTLEMEVQNPKASIMDILTYTAFSVVPEGIVGDIEGYEGDIEHDAFRQQQANGTGPFELDTFTLDEEVLLTRFDDYHGEVASLEEVHFNIVEDPEAWFTLIVEQNLDIFAIPTSARDSELISVDSEDDRGREIGTYGPLENGETLEYLSVPQLVTRYFGFNARHVPPAVRKAFAYAMDHEELCNTVFDGTRTPAYSFTPPSIFPGGLDAYEDFVQDYPYGRNETDLESAREVLAEAGYSEDDPFSLTCNTYDAASYESAAQLLRDKLAGNGVEMEIQRTQFATLIESGENGEMEMYTLGWGWSYESVAYGMFGFEPKNSDTDKIPEDANGYYLDWQVELEEEA